MGTRYRWTRVLRRNCGRKTQNSFFLSGPAEGSADDAIALSAMASYKTQNPFGFVLEDLSEDPEINKYI